MSYILDALKKSEQEREQKQAQNSASISHQSEIVENVSLPRVNSQEIVQKTVKKSKKKISNQYLNQEKINILGAFSGSPLIKSFYLLLVLLAVFVLINSFIYKDESSLKSLRIDQNQQFATQFTNHTQTTQLTSGSVEASDSMEANLVEKNTQITKKIEPQEVIPVVTKGSNEKTEPRENVQFRATDNSEAEFYKEHSIAIEEAAEDIVSDLPSMNISSHIFSTQADRRSIVVNGQRLVEGSYVASGVKVAEITHQGMMIQVKGRLLVVSRSRGWK